MPGAPNRPPEAAPAPPPPAAADPPEARLLRRLVPSHVALLQESWKGGPPAEVLGPFEKAEGAFRAADFATATTALDQLSIRFAEPRWPSLAEPFRRLRVAIPAPTPPHWDPDHGRSAEEKEARKARRTAEEQLALAEASIAWAAGHGLACGDLTAPLEAARAALSEPGVPPPFYEAVDRIWRELRGRLPPPQRAAAAPRVAAAEEA
jgi:hypothetical protein